MAQRKTLYSGRLVSIQQEGSNFGGPFPLGGVARVNVEITMHHSQVATDHRVVATPPWRCPIRTGSAHSIFV